MNVKATTLLQFCQVFSDLMSNLPTLLLVYRHLQTGTEILETDLPVAACQPSQTGLGLGLGL